VTRATFVPTVYTPASERHVRNMILSGSLPAFRLGDVLLRIRAEDVERFECQNGGSQDSGESSASHGMTESGDVIDLEHQIQKRRPASPRLDTQSLRGPAGRP
jgi:hypothetical protein